MSQRREGTERMARSNDAHAVVDGPRARAAATGRLRFGRVDGAAAERCTRVVGLGVRKAVMTVSSGRRAASRTEMVRFLAPLAQAQASYHC